MSKFVLSGLCLAATASLAYAGVTEPLPAPAATPGPLLGAIAGPWGLVASGLGYAAYRFYRSKR
jgi:hypothetical protein